MTYKMKFEALKHQGRNKSNKSSRISRLRIVKIKSDGCLFTLYFDYSRKNIDRETKFK